jgi:hypothetical protein
MTGAIRRGWPAARDDLLAALPGWAVARVLVLGALAAAHFLANNLHVQDPAVRLQVHQGLFAWDAGFYRGIAQHGYGFGPVHHDAVRFFPLLPLAARGLGTLFGGRAGVALLVIVEPAALVLGALIHRLVLVEGKSRATAERAAWWVALFPSAFVLVLGYAEAPAMALAVGVFLALRTQRWWWAAGLGVLAGLSRPLGVLLVVPALVEVGRALVAARNPGSRGPVSGRPPAGSEAGTAAGTAAVSTSWPTWPTWSAWLAAVAGAPAGLLVFLLWSWRRYGDFLLPLRVQTAATHRGQAVDPITALFHEARGALHGQHVGSALHVPWAVVFIGLAAVCFRRWPASYGAFAAVVLLIALTSKNLDSLERYGLGAFPLVLVIAELTTDRRVERAWAALSATALAGYALLAFLNAYVP